MISSQPQSRQPHTGSVPPLADDTLADKAVRFVCGAFFGFLVVLGVAEFGEVLTLEGYMLVGAVVVAACGALGVTHGERFFEGLLKVFRWLSF